MPVIDRRLDQSEPVVSADPEAWLNAPAQEPIVPRFGGLWVELPEEDDDDIMCPNCVTPWKCNGPHETGGEA